ncbi:MAG TPA: polyprenyl synthetase family protein [Burkholderiaceae bacterium]|nr:polyprenyl synthetase family protein [Burkholderiaceae bacterium]
MRVAGPRRPALLRRRGDPSRPPLGAGGLRRAARGARRRRADRARVPRARRGPAPVAGGTGTPFGIVAGQAWECEPRVALADYQRAKTGALFAAATAAGAEAAGVDGRVWRGLGDRLGEAYQVADDIRDVLSDPDVLGKPIGQDVLLGRPSAARELGLDGAIFHFQSLVAQAIAAIPDCAGASRLRALVWMESERLVPKAWCEDAARRALA